MRTRSCSANVTRHCSVSLCRQARRSQLRGRKTRLCALKHPPDAQTGTRSPLSSFDSASLPPGRGSPEASSLSSRVTPELATAEAFQSIDSGDLIGGNKFLEASICRLYFFSEPQKLQFQQLMAAMLNSRSALTALAASNIMLSLVQAAGYVEREGNASAAVLFDSGLTIGDVAYWADSLMVAFLISYAIGPFKCVLRSRTNQMAYCFQGLNRLALIFQQLSIGSIAVSTVTALEAAAKYPPLVVGTSAVFFGVAVVRSGAMWWTLSRHASNKDEVSRTLTAIRNPRKSESNEMGMLDRWATFLAFGYLLEYEQKAPQASLPSELSAPSASTSTALAAPAAPVMVYEFSLAEERLLKGLTEAASTAGLALGLQAFVTLMLAVADFGVEDFPGVLGNGVNGANKAVMAAILFNACSSYDRAMHTAGSNDVEHLMDGLGNKGLTGLFDSLALLSWAVSIATCLTFTLPWVQDSLLAKFVGDGLSHRTAEAVIKVLEYGRAIMRGI